MKISIVTGMLFAALLLAATPALPQVAVEVTGVMEGGDRVTGQGFLGDLKRKQSVQPSVKLLFNSEGRISGGVSVTKGSNYAPLTFTLPVHTDGFWYTGPDGTLRRVDIPGTIFTSTTTTESGRITAIVSALGRVNLLTSGPVRPYVGGRYGIALAKEEYHTETFIHPLFRELRPEFAFEIRPSRTISKNIRIVTVEGGTVVRLTEHINLTMGGGGNFWEKRKTFFGEGGVRFIF